MVVLLLMDECKISCEFKKQNMEDLENGLDEKGLIDFVKTVLLSGNNPRGNEALENLKWGIKQYRKQLILHGVSDTLIAWQQFRDAKWYESDSTDVDKMLMDKFQAI